MVTREFIEAEYPLHWLVWENSYAELNNKLKNSEVDKEKKDNRGRTPLMLAVTLGHLESVRTLLNNEANVNCENLDGWSILQEAVATGDPEILQLILERREFQKYSSRMAGIPELLQKLKDAPDFYVEMKWEFTSWVPMVSKFCPSDTYKVYKKGSNVRIDTTLLGFDQSKQWQRGNRSYIFKGRQDGATMMEIDHDLRHIFTEEMHVVEETAEVLLSCQEQVAHRLTTPIVTTYIDTDKISFERNKAGIWGWRSDKTEVINGFNCKVFNASNVELVTKTRTEHLTESDKARSKNNKTPLENFLGITEVEENPNTSKMVLGTEINLSNPHNITPEQYFDSQENLDGRDIGRPKELNIKVQKFGANLWLCEEYPLSLPEQILPIVDLMAISSSHFSKLRDFIQMQLPSGFPVKIEIPLFHVLNARITFGNIFALDCPVKNVTKLEGENETSCIIDEEIFDSPPGYVQLGSGAEARRQFSMEEEDDLLQFAIQQSLIESGTEKEEVDIWEALKGQKPSRPTTPNFIGEEERQLQRAIQASLELCQESHSSCEITESNELEESTDQDLHKALLLSQKEQQEAEALRLQEEKLLEEILQLSMTEK